MLASTTQAFVPTLTVDACLSQKIKLVGKGAAAYAGCYSKAAAAGGAVDTGCLDKASGKITGGFGKIDGKYPACTGGVGNGSARDAATASHAGALEGIVGATPGGSKCDAAKRKCVGKYVAAITGCYAKAAKKAPGVVDNSGSGCTAKAVAKLFDGTKGCLDKAAASGDCANAGNQSGALSTQANAFIHAQVCTLDPANPACTCGDGATAGSEECDGDDDASCVGSCGSPTSPFACLCQDPAHRRQAVIEHAGADLDLGWTGEAHDASVVEGGGYVTDLWDCDGPLGPDTICTVGPSCSGGSHASCSPAKTSPVTGDSICAGLGEGTCRKTLGGVTGPHCRNDLQKRCASSAQCSVGDVCVKTMHGPPVPLSAAGLSLCMVNFFSEDVVGTADLATGSSAVRIRQDTHAEMGDLFERPCPVCGGYCSGPGRPPCSSNADCTGGAVCVTDAVCSSGPNIDQPCRTTPPFGGGTTFFGPPSVDCPPTVTTSGIDVLINPMSSSSVSMDSNVACASLGFGGKTCVDGTSAGRPCTTMLDCPGGACRDQCFCPLMQRPNGCDAACVGGTFDAAPCTDDSDCDPPNGFCHLADCREDVLDTDSASEGICTSGPVDFRCSVTNYKLCTNDADCAAPLCPSCVSGETCVIQPRQCFVNGRIERAGTPGTSRAGIFCMSSTSYLTVNNAWGFPGPGAVTQPVTTMEVGF